MKPTSHIVFFCVFVMIIFISIISKAVGQVCSATGHLCTRDTDCCKGCCKSNACIETCEEGPLVMPSVPGMDSCDRLYCPAGQACFYREVCPPEDPCPRIPGCRRIDIGMNSTDPYRYYRNSSDLECESLSTSLMIIIGSITPYVVKLLI